MVWLDKSNNSNVLKTYLYSLSCRIATGSKPWGFCTGVMRFCFCCIWSMEDPCWPGGWGVTELPAIGTTGTTETWGGAGDGRPLAAGVRCFWAFPWPSPAWTADTKYCYYYCMIFTKKRDSCSSLQKKKIISQNKSLQDIMLWHCVLI